MNRKAVRYAILALAPVAAIVLAGCKSSSKPPEPTDKVSTVETKNGVMVVETIKAQANVIAVDGKKRTVTVQTAEGQKTIKCGPQVVNFNQISVGDKVMLTLTQEIALSVTTGTPPALAEGAVVTVSPKGDKPGVALADMAQVTVKVLAIDSVNRTVTIKMPNAITKTIKVGNDARLDKLKVGDDVTVQYAQSVAIEIKK